ncbi:NmrA-like domain-containing protein, partial [Lipomyces tetrasporus]
GSVARQLLKDGEFKVKAATRDPSKESAKALDALGAEVVAVDNSVQRDLDKAFDGVYGAFAITNFWEHLDMSREEEDGKRMADTATKYGVQHYLRSTVLNPREITNGKVTGAAANQGKANVDIYIRTIPSLLKATTIISTGVYYTNSLSDIMKPRKEGGAYILKLPVS